MTITELETKLRIRRLLPPPELRRALRISAHASLADVAAAVGVTRAAVSFWELGINEPSAAHAEAYAQVLEVFREVGGP